jgi:zinc/manganese transport system substrate-binding protein
MRHRLLRRQIMGAAAAIGMGLLPAAASAKVNAVVTLTDLADITRQVGGNRVAVSCLTEGYQDPHAVEPRFSQVAQLSRAQLFVMLGMDYDVWANALLDAARNGAIVRGGRGHVQASRGVAALEVPTGQIRPDQGDIHIYGNPHILLDPGNAKLAARNIRDGLKRVDPTGSATYDANYTSFARRVDDALDRWESRLARARGTSVVTYHKTFAYFLRRFGMRELTTLEPKPGIPPSLSHVRGVIGQMKQARTPLILIESHRSRRYPNMVATQTGAKVVAVPTAPGMERGIDSYIEMMDTLVSRVAGALG